MKKSLLILLSALLMLSVAGCGAGTQTVDGTSIPIVDKSYLNNSPLSEKTLDFDFLKNSNNYAGAITEDEYSPQKQNCQIRNFSTQFQKEV